ncbi:MAG: alcohol dehydrogenase catalytic domain-containing protein [Candidatus Eremiobacterota bacterium]
MLTRVMKAAVAHDYDDVRVEETEVPRPGPGEAVVRIKACGICTGDVTPWYIRKKCPIVVGHEPAGVVHEVGPEVTAFRPGDRVFVHHHAPCMRCRHCQRGFYTMCPTWRASHLVPGGIAEYVLVPRQNLECDTLRLPEALSFEDGTLIEPVACVVKAFRRAGMKPGERVVVLGLGFIGQVMVRLAREYGSPLVLGSDPVAWRRERALEAGASRVVDPTREDFPTVVRDMTGGGADVVMVGPSSLAAMQEGIRCAGPGSTVLLFMGPAPDATLEVNPNHLFFQEISLVSSYSCGPDDTRETLKLLERGVLSAADLVTHRFPLEQTLEACRVTARAQDSLKVLVTL